MLLISGMDFIDFSYFIVQMVNNLEKLSIQEQHTSASSSRPQISSPLGGVTGQLWHQDAVSFFNAEHLSLWQNYWSLWPYHSPVIDQNL